MIYTPATFVGPVTAGAQGITTLLMRVHVVRDNSESRHELELASKKSRAIYYHHKLLSLKYRTLEVSDQSMPR